MKSLVLLSLVSSIGFVANKCLEPMRCGGGGGPPSSCNRNCFLNPSSCSSPCPYCKRITATNWQCRADTCSMACASSSECKGSCPVCFAAKCQQCQADSHCLSAFGSAKPFCKRITAINRECRADTCSMFCTSSSECKGRCGKCRWMKCKSKGWGVPPSSDTCSMACASSSECKGSCSVCFAAKCQECQSDSHCRATFGSAKPYCKRITVTKRECRADTCSMFCTSSSECKGRCGKCRWLKCTSKGCFLGESLVALEGGKVKQMKDIRLGDDILTVKDGKVVSTKVLGFLDKRINQTTDYLKLDVKDGRSLFISPTHAMFIKGEGNTVESILPKDARLGDFVFLQDNMEIVSAQINDILVQSKQGAYVPLTDEGTLLVDGILVSCYTNTDHWMAHAALAPLRWWPSLLLENDKTQDMEGLRTVPGLVRTLGRMLGLVMDEASQKRMKNLIADLPCLKSGCDTAKTSSNLAWSTEL